LLKAEEKVTADYHEVADGRSLADVDDEYAVQGVGHRRHLAGDAFFNCPHGEV